MIDIFLNQSATIFESLTVENSINIQEIILISLKNKPKEKKTKV